MKTHLIKNKRILDMDVTKTKCGLRGGDLLRTENIKKVTCKNCLRKKNRCF